MSDGAAQQGVEADEAEHNGASQLNSSVGPTSAGGTMARQNSPGKTRLVAGSLVSGLMLSLGCASHGPTQEAPAASPMGITVDLRLVSDSTQSGATLLKMRQADLSLRELRCPAQTVMVEAALSVDGRVMRTRILKPSSALVLDAACQRATYQRLQGRSANPVTLECTLRCE